MRSSKSFVFICIMVFRTLYTRATIVLEGKREEQEGRVEGEDGTERREQTQIIDQIWL